MKFARVRTMTALAASAFGMDAFAQNSRSPNPPVARQAASIEEAAPASFTLQQICDLAVERHPSLAQGAARIDAARGRAMQACLYPNPVLSITGDELGDKQGAAGIWTAPQVSQELVMGGKRRLASAASAREVDQNAFLLASKRFALLGEVRQAYFDVLALQARTAILGELAGLSEKTVEQTNVLLQSKLVAPLNLIQLEVERERVLADRDAAEREKTPALRKLAAAAGVSDLAIERLEGSVYDPLPEYDLDRARPVVRQHPEIFAAVKGVEKARLLVDRARAQATPNVTVSAGYVRQSQNRSNDWMIGASLPIPVFDRNQGNVQAALAELTEASHEASRVENALQERLATAFREYQSSKARVERYRGSILSRAEKAYELSVQAYRGGEFEYLRVLEAQRTVGQAKLELARALADAWKAAAVISGILIEERWPLLPMQ